MTILIVVLGASCLQESRRVNNLTDGGSAYLAAQGGPIKWHPWGEEAFRLARRLDRPLLVSVGAAWCQLCARMDREAFTDVEMAGLIDSLFVSIKIDRDLSPAIDARLQRAVRALTGLEGWPIEAVLTPAGDPYFGATYLPPSDPATGRGLKEVLTQAAEAYRENKARVAHQAAIVAEVIRERGSKTVGLVRVEVLDSVVMWTTRDHSGNPSAAALLFEMFAAGKDSTYRRLGIHALLACTGRENPAGGQHPGLLDAFAAGYAATGDMELRKEAGTRAMRAADVIDTSWAISYSDQLGFHAAGVIAVGLVLDDAELVQRGVAFVDSLLALAYKPGAGVRHRLGAGGDPEWLDDQVAVAWAAVHAHRATAERRYLRAALDLMEFVGRGFGDPVDGGYYDLTTAWRRGPLVRERLKPVHDGFLPAANPIAARIALELYRQTGDEQWLSTATRTLEAFAATPPAGGRLAEYGRAVQGLLAVLSRGGR